MKKLMASKDNEIKNIQSLLDDAFDKRKMLQLTPRAFNLPTPTTYNHLHALTTQSRIISLAAHCQLKLSHG